MTESSEPVLLTSIRERLQAARSHDRAVYSLAVRETHEILISLIRLVGNGDALRIYDRFESIVRTEAFGEGARGKPRQFL